MLEVIRTDYVDHKNAVYIRISKNQENKLWEYIVYLGGLSKKRAVGYKTKEDALSEAWLFVNSYKEDLAH